MALIVCPECGKRISEYASECPSCGYPVSNDCCGTLITCPHCEGTGTCQASVSLLRVFEYGRSVFANYCDACQNNNGICSVCGGKGYYRI